MNNPVSRHKNIIYYAITILALCVGLFLWVNQGDETKTAVDETGSTVEAIKQAVEDLQKDHDGQDALAVCLGKLVIATQSRTVTDADYQQCVITTAVPSIETDEGREPEGQTTAPAQPSGSSSSSSFSSPNNTPPPPPSQPDNSLKPTNPPSNPPPPEEPEPTNLLPLVEECVIGVKLLGGCL